MESCLKALDLTPRFLIPVGAALAVVMGLLIWAVSVTQTRAAEMNFKEHLTSLAAASRFMIHSAAAEYCSSRDMVFHKVLPGQIHGAGPAADFERAAMQAFERDPSLPFLSLRYLEPDGVPRMYVLAAAKLQEACVSCHAASGMKLLDGRRNGDIVGAFGVSVSTLSLQRNIANMRLMAGLIGLGMLIVVSLIVAFFVNWSIVRPLASLSGSINQIAQGDLTVRASVQSQDEVGRLARTFNAMVDQLNQANHAYMEMLAFVSHEQRLWRVGELEQMLTAEALSALYGRAVAVREDGGRRFVYPLASGVSRTGSDA